MLPLRDTVPSSRFPAVTALLMVVNVLGFLYEVSAGPHLGELLGRYALTPAHFTDAIREPGAWLPVFTSMFLHGGVGHLGGNLLFLWIFGDNVEDLLGRARFLLFYLASGVAAALTHIYFSPDSPVPMLGASGAIAGVLGAYFIHFPRSRVLTWFPPIFFFYVPALFFLGVWFVMQILNGGMSMSASYQEGGGIAFLAHAGGFVAGLALSLLMRPEEKPRNKRRELGGDWLGPYSVRRGL